MYIKSQYAHLLLYRWIWYPYPSCVCPDKYVPHGYGKNHHGYGSNDYKKDHHDGYGNNYKKDYRHDNNYKKDHYGHNDYKKDGYNSHKGYSKKT